jgi:hypothetical protein
LPDSHSGPKAVAANPELSQDERAELDRLRGESAELDRLRAEVAGLRGEKAAPAPRRRRGWRAPVAAILIVAGCLLAPVSVLAVWTASQVSDTGRYVANVEPLIQDPAIQNVLTDKIANEVTSNLHVTAYTDQAAVLLTGKGLPRVGALLKTFAPSISSAVTGFIHSQVHKLVAGPLFARAWVRANTAAHKALVIALSGRGNGAVGISNGQVTIDLGPFIGTVKQDLVARGFTLANNIPAIHPTFALFSAKYLVKARSAYRLINDLKIVLPILSVLLMALGVYIARGHRRALIGAGLGLAGSMLLLGAGLLIFRGVYLNSVPASVLPADAAAALFDTLVRFIKEGLRAILVLGLVVAAGAFLVGPSITAIRTRAAFASALGWVRQQAVHAGLRTGPAGPWTYTHKTALRVSAVALAVLIFVFWGQPTGLVVIVITIVLLVVVGLIELIGRPPTQPKTAST